MGFLGEELVSLNGFTTGDNLQDTRSWPGTGPSTHVQWQWGVCVCLCMGGHSSWFLNLEFPGCKPSPQSIAVL